MVQPRSSKSLMKPFSGWEEGPRSYSKGLRLTISHHKSLRMPIHSENVIINQIDDSIIGTVIGQLLLQTNIRVWSQANLGEATNQNKWCATLLATWLIFFRAPILFVRDFIRASLLSMICSFQCISPRSLGGCRSVDGDGAGVPVLSFLPGWHYNVTMIYFHRPPTSAFKAYKSC